MPREYPPEVRRQVIELARSGARVKQLAATFEVSQVTIYNWLKRSIVARSWAKRPISSSSSPWGLADQL